MTGDLAKRDGDGFFSYEGRADDMLKIGGIWVAPMEIERCLADHADVVEAAVVGADREGLTRICAFAVPRAGAHLSGEALRAFVRERLSGHKVPHEVQVVAQLPKTGSGKVDRRALRETAATLTTGVLDA